MALTDKLTAIANAIRSKTGETEKMTLDQMPTKIGGIETGGGIDLSQVTATESDVIAGKKIYLANGTLAAGTIPIRSISDIVLGPDKNRVDIPDGYYPETFSYYFPESCYQFHEISFVLSDIEAIKEIFDSMIMLARYRNPLGSQNPAYPLLIASADTKNPIGAWCTYYYDASQSQGFIVGCATIDGETLFELKMSGTYSGAEDTCDSASVDYIKYGGQSIIDSFTSVIVGVFM